jgi:hypothetical protein
MKDRQKYKFGGPALRLGGRPVKCVTKLRLCLSLCLLLTLVGSLAAQVRQPLQPPKQVGPKLPALLTSQPIKEDPKDDELCKLLKARYNLAFAEMQRGYKAWRLGLSSFDAVTDVAQQLVKSGLELIDKPAERAAFLGQYVELMKEAEKIVQEQYKHGMVPQIEVYRARYLRLDAEIQLLRAKREVDKAKDKAPHKRQ